MKTIITAAVLATAISAGAAVQSPLWIRDARISPDGFFFNDTATTEIYTE